MNPTIPNVEASVLDHSAERLDTKAALESQTGSNGNSSVDRLQDVESRESKIGPSGGGQQQDDDDARSQVAAINSQATDSPAPAALQPVQASSQSDDDDVGQQADSTFVDKVKKVIRETSGDPEERVNKVAQVQAEFIMQKFNHQVKLPKAES